MVGGSQETCNESSGANKSRTCCGLLVPRKKQAITAVNCASNEVDTANLIQAVCTNRWSHSWLLSRKVTHHTSEQTPDLSTAVAWRVLGSLHPPPPPCLPPHHFSHWESRSIQTVLISWYQLVECIYIT